MDYERYKAWLHRRVEKSDQSLAKHGLTKKSDPQEKPLLYAVRINRALHAALDYDAMEIQYINRISNALDYLERLMMRGQISAAIYDKADKLLKGKEKR